jgi:cytochrome c-type biogenesis protein CcmH
MRTVFAVLLLALAITAGAREAAPLAEDPVLEQRAMRLAEELRCLVCQNQSLAESNADLALDLKDQVREQIKAGRTDAEIRDYMVARYGDFVLYRPPVKAATLLLWAGPFVLLIGAVLGLGLYVRRRGGRVVETELSTEQHERAQAMLRSGREGGSS